MAKVVMLETKPGSEDGLRVKMYMKGRQYEIGDFLLESFILMGCVKLIEENNDGFLEPIDGYQTPAENYSNKAIEPMKRGRGRPKKDGI